MHAVAELVLQIKLYHVDRKIYFGHPLPSTKAFFCLFNKHNLINAICDVGRQGQF